MTRDSALTPKPIEDQIFLVRGQKVLLDADLAALYGVEVKALNQAVKRNPDRFPSDFVFRLTPEEDEALRSQIVTSKSSRGGRRYAPYAFTEHGAIMAASVLNSPRAVEMSIYVVRAFLRLREMLATHKALAAKLAELTCTESGKRSAKSWTSRGGRFSSTRSFKDRYPLRDAGEELVNGLEVFLFEVGELAEDLLLGHSGGEVRSQIVDAEAQAADAGLSSHLAGFDRDSRVQSVHSPPRLLA